MPSPHVVYWPDMIANPLFCCHCFNLRMKLFFSKGEAVYPEGAVSECHIMAVNKLSVAKPLTSTAIKKGKNACRSNYGWGCLSFKYQKV